MSDHYTPSQRLQAKGRPDDGARYQLSSRFCWNERLCASDINGMDGGYIITVLVMKTLKYKIDQKWPKFLDGMRLGNWENDGEKIAIVSMSKYTMRE